MAVFNISGETTVELLPSDSHINISSVRVANTHATLSTYVDLYVGTISKTEAATKYYLNKGYLLYKGETLILNFKLPIGFGLYIKLTGVSTTSPTVDVIIE